MTINDSIFESIKHISEKGEEYWFARELQTALEYTQWRNFQNVIDKAKISCKNAENDVELNFAEISKKVKVGAGERLVDDYILSRYACYLIVQNGEPHSSNPNSLKGSDFFMSGKGVYINIFKKYDSPF